MFRLLSANTQQTLRPAILLKVRSNKANISLPSSSIQVNPPSPAQYNLTCQFTRQNSSASSQKTKSSKVDAFVNKAQRDPVLREALDSEANSKLNYFKEQLSLAFQYRSAKDRDSQRAFVATVDNLFKAFEDESLRSSYSSRDLYSYTQILNFSVYHNRTNRLSSSRNEEIVRQYQNENLHDEVLIKSAVFGIPI